MNDPKEPSASPAVRRVLSLGRNSVTFCTWCGERPHHAHAIYDLARGATVSVGDDVPQDALGKYVAHHWYRRVGDECLMAHGDGTLCDHTGDERKGTEQQAVVQQKKPGAPMTEKVDNVLFYAISPANKGIVFAVPERARYVSRLHAAMNAKTWGDFRRQIPRNEWAAIRQELTACDVKARDKDAFDSQQVPGFCDGDWPPWLQQEIGKVLPLEILERYAKRVNTSINGSYWHIEREHLREILKALKDRGIRAKKAPDLTFY